MLKRHIFKRTLNSSKVISEKFNTDITYDSSIH